MKLEHLIKTAGNIAGIKVMTIFGSQSILGQHPIKTTFRLFFFQKF